MKTGIYMVCVLCMMVSTNILFAQNESLSKFNYDNPYANQKKMVHKAGFYLQAVQFGVNAGATFNEFDYVVSADGQLNFHITDRHFFTTDLAYVVFTAKGKRDQNFTPIKFGLKYFMADNFYLHPEIGTAIRLVGELRPDYVASFGFGYVVGPIDLSLRYEDYATFDGAQATFRVGYTF